MENNVKIFTNEEFGELEVLDIDGKMYFPAVECAKTLGYADPKGAIRDHCKTPGVLKRPLGVQTGFKKDGTPAIQVVEKKYINEGNLYRLIIKSRLPAAERFEEWVFEEVLPSIMRTGAYVSPQIATALSCPEKDYEYWTNLKEDSEDFQLLLKQERANIGKNEQRKKARKIAKDEYREYHANSPILIGTSKLGYQLTDEAKERILDYLENGTEERTKTIIIYNKISGTKPISDLEAIAINDFMETVCGWNKIYFVSNNKISEKIFNQPTYQTWQRVLCNV